MENHVETLPLSRRFWRLAIPNILAAVLVPLAGIVDVAMLGHLDSIHHLAGVALGSILFDYLYFSFNFLRMVTTGITAQGCGRRDWLEVERTLLRGGVVALALGAVILL